MRGLITPEAIKRLHEELSDEALEQLINAWTVILSHETNHDYQCTAMRRQRELVAQRSKAQVELMERKRNLR